MRSVVVRSGATALCVVTLLGADIALAGEEGLEPTRMPFHDRGRQGQYESVTVAEGDHLWKISENHLRDRARRPVSDSEIGPYWRRVIEQNLESLRSGDPDLIYPGEVIELPEIEISGQP